MDDLAIYRPGSARPVREWVAPESYPRMCNLSARFSYGDVMVRVEDPAPPEYVTVPIRAPLVEVALARRDLAYDLFVQSCFESSPRSRLLALATALEVLAEPDEPYGSREGLVGGNSSLASKRSAGRLLHGAPTAESLATLASRLARCVANRLDRPSGTSRAPIPGALCLAERMMTTSSGGATGRGTTPYTAVAKEDLDAIIGPLEGVVARLTTGGPEAAPKRP